jgi:hypothetical protein
MSHDAELVSLAQAPACIASLIENRQREVGLALFNAGTLTLRLLQYIEQGRSYSMTQLLLAAHAVEAAVVVSSAVSARVFAAASLSQSLRACGVPTFGLPRRSFDDTRGLEATMACCNKGSQAAIAQSQVRMHHPSSMDPSERVQTPLGALMASL